MQRCNVGDRFGSGGDADPVDRVALARKKARSFVYTPVRGSRSSATRPTLPGFEEHDTSTQDTGPPIRRARASPLSGSGPLGSLPLGGFFIFLFFIFVFYKNIFSI